MKIIKFINNIFSEDFLDLLFRLCFCSIFLGLGLEHLFSDELILKLMPLWVPYPRMVSILCGLILVFGGSTIILGYYIQIGAMVLIVFLIVITTLVHGIGVLVYPENLPLDYKWIWDILQRTNLVKNLCLFGVCIKLLNYKPGKYSLSTLLYKKKLV